MRLVNYKEFEFDIDELINKDKIGKRTVLETICSNIMLDNMTHEEIVVFFDNVLKQAKELGYDTYKVLEAMEPYTDFTTLIGACERYESDEEYEARLLRKAYKAKKSKIAYQNKRKKKKAAENLQKFKSFYDNE